MDNGILVAVDQTADSGTAVRVANNVLSGGIVGSGIVVDSLASENEVVSNTVVTEQSAASGIDADAAAVVRNNVVRGVFTTPTVH
ncbi:MAG: hypothetical protein AAFQ82_23970 [Myxococcota bacterium]